MIENKARVIGILKFATKNNVLEGVHLTFLPHIFPVQVKSGACYIAGQWGRVQNKVKET